MLKEFREFAFKGNVIDLAIGVVIGGAFGKIVSGIVDDLIMPLVSLVLPGGDWRTTEVPIGNSKLKVGHLIGTMIDFVLVAFVLFLVINKLVRRNRAASAAQPAPATRECPACAEQVSIKARRCKFCSEALAVS
jgi:large conductance mechanosensitive channel